MVGAVGCWVQPQLARSRLNSGRPGRAPVSDALRYASAGACLLLALATVISIPIEHGLLPIVLGQLLAVAGAIALLGTLVILFRERGARKS